MLSISEQTGQNPVTELSLSLNIELDFIRKSEEQIHMHTSVPSE